jgi:UDP-N-acetylmuramoylalanine--D-glutamate ligase
LSSQGLGELTSWHSDWSSTRVVVIGLGVTGFSVLDTLVELGASVTVIAKDAESDVHNIAEVLGARVIISDQDDQRARAAREVVADFAVVSPGVSPEDPALVVLQDRAVPVLSDVDFAWRVRDKFPHVAQWVVVVGDLFAHQAADLACRIGQADGQKIAVAGLDAPPLLDLIRDPLEYDTIILQPSMQSLRWWLPYPESPREPLLSVMVEQVAPEYAGVVYEGTRLACIYWRGEGPTEGFVERAEVVEGARAIGVGGGSPGMSELGLVEGILCDRAFLEDRQNQALEISTLEELSEGGLDIHTQLPAVMAAVAISRALDVPPALIAGVLSLP